MNASTESRFHWTQRLALIRHNLHSASRSGNYTFFKTLQAHAFIEGTDYVSKLTNGLGDASDALLSTLDTLNAGIAYVHEDAYRNVYNGLKATLANENINAETRRAIFQVDTQQQKQMTEHAIDKMLNSAVSLIEQQPSGSQDDAVSLLILGTTIIADAIDIIAVQTARMEQDTDDFIRLEDSWSTVQRAVVSAIGALKGIFNLMSINDRGDCGCKRARSGSNSSSTSWVRRMSSAFTSGSTGVSSSAASRRGSIASFIQSPPSMSSPATLVLPTRTSISNACPTAVPSSKRPLSSGSLTILSPIPPTPAAAMMIDPFDKLVAQEDKKSVLATPPMDKALFFDVEAQEIGPTDATSFPIMSLMSTAAHSPTMEEIPKRRGGANILERSSTLEQVLTYVPFC